MVMYEAPRSIPSLFGHRPPQFSWVARHHIPGEYLSVAQVVGVAMHCAGQLSRHSSVSFGHFVDKTKGSPPVAGGKALCF